MRRADRDGAHARNCEKYRELIERTARGGTDAERMEAAGWLGCGGLRSLEVAEAATRDPVPGVRLAAVRVLVAILMRNPESNIDGSSRAALREALRDPVVVVRIAAAVELVRYEEERDAVVAALAESLRSEDARLRGEAAGVLAAGGLGAAKVAESIALDEAVAMPIRIDAVRLLGKVWSSPEPEAADAMLVRVAALGEDDLTAHAIAARGLRQNAPAGALADVVRLTDAVDEKARCIALAALATPLAEIQQIPFAAPHGNEEQLRDQAAGGICVMRNLWPDAVNGLKDVARAGHHPASREWAKQTLTCLGKGDAWREP